MHSTQVLPFRCTHLGASDGGAWRVVGEQPHNDGVDLLYEEAAKLV
jgi:hypothetical protein